MSSVARPLAVARGGQSKLDGYPGKEHGDGPVRQSRRRSPRCVVDWESEKLREVLSEKASRCLVGPHIGIASCKIIDFISIRVKSNSFGRNYRTDAITALERSVALTGGGTGFDFVFF